MIFVELNIRNVLEVLQHDPYLFFSTEEEGHGAPLGFGQGRHPLS
jgi:hypothetical protein